MKKITNVCYCFESSNIIDIMMIYLIWGSRKNKKFLR